MMLQTPTPTRAIDAGTGHADVTLSWSGVVEELSSSGYAEWDAYVGAHALGNVYHLSAWKTVAQRAYGMKTPFLVARDRARGPVRGVLPLFVVDSVVSRYVITSLFGGYGALLADSDGARRALLDRACAITRRSRARHLKLKSLHDAECPPGFDRRDMGSVATLPLAGGPDELWKGFRNKMRNAIRKAQKSGLELRVGPAQLPHFYDVLAENYHRKGTPIYGVEVMRELCSAMGDRAEVVALWKDGRAASGALVVYHKGTVYVPFCSSRAELFNLNPNNLIYWEIIKRACERGMSTLDFGRSPNDSGSMAFKLSWGAVLTPQPYFIYTARGEPPALDVEDPAVARLIKLWQALPRPVVDALGPWVHGHFLA